MEKEKIVIEKTVMKLNDNEQNILAAAFAILAEIVDELEDNEYFMNGANSCTYRQDLQAACVVLRYMAQTDVIEIER